MGRCRVAAQRHGCSAPGDLWREAIYLAERGPGGRWHPTGGAGECGLLAASVGRGPSWEHRTPPAAWSHVLGGWFGVMDSWLAIMCGWAFDVRNLRPFGCVQERPTVAKQEKKRGERIEG